ncbi:hypothetical protein MES4922_20140 [Mesorhizobium ventifaucium]|uniref:Uncharacterized protein n=1 Tax=Mesorhizobium ventifaucium TaxID=666020 RepID=A0ABM9DPF5_9HYPH|nr:hypothetical protein MES4922_20140 [Mesorhizobium ventifaucium]
MSGDTFGRSFMLSDDAHHDAEGLSELLAPSAAESGFATGCTKLAFGRLGARTKRS